MALESFRMSYSFNSNNNLFFVGRIKFASNEIHCCPSVHNRRCRFLPCIACLYFGEEEKNKMNEIHVKKMKLDFSHLALATFAIL